MSSACKSEQCLPLVQCDKRPRLCFALDIATIALNPAVKDLHLDLLFDRTVGSVPAGPLSPGLQPNGPEGAGSVKAVLSTAPCAAALQQLPVAEQLQGCLCLCCTRGAAQVPLDCWRGAGSMETGAVAMAKSFHCWLAHGPAGKNAGARRRDTRWSRGWQEGRGEPAYVHSRNYKDSRSWQSRGHTPRRKEWERGQRHSAELKKKKTGGECGIWRGEIKQNLHSLQIIE